MGEGETRIEGYLDAADTRSTLAAVRGAGRAEVTTDGPAARALDAARAPADPGRRPARRRARPRSTSATPAPCCGCCRAGSPGRTAASGRSTATTRSASARSTASPSPLREMGADLRCREERLPPLEIAGAPLRGIEYELPVASAQVKSCLLFAGLLAEGETRVVEPLPTRDHTERMLAAAGADGAPRGCAGGRAAPRSCVEPAERARARPHRRPRRPLLGRLLHRRRAAGRRQRGRAREVGLNPTRTGLLTILERMGAEIEVDRRRRGGRRADRRPPRPRHRPARDRGRRRRGAAGDRRAAPGRPRRLLRRRARRRSATPPSCAARSPTGSPPSATP